MAKFEASTCDNEDCGRVFPTSAMTIKTTRYKGPTVTGTIESEICPECTEKETAGLELKTRASRTPRAQEAPQAATDPVAIEDDPVTQG